MSNSALVNYTLLSPNYTPGNFKKDEVTIHCFVGQVTARQGCQEFASKSKGASCNYVVGYDGSKGLCVEEHNQSWCSSNSANDKRAITIEVACDAYYPYRVTNAAYAALIDLLVDICQRNSIKRLLWKGDPSLIGQVSKQNMTVHRWFANKSCPGDYLYNLHPQIAAEVNKKLEENRDMTKAETLALINETLEKKNPTYHTLAQVPSYWREDVKGMMDAGIITGNSPTDLGLTRTEAKAAVISWRMHKLK